MNISILSFCFALSQECMAADQSQIFVNEQEEGLLHLSSGIILRPVTQTPDESKIQEIQEEMQIIQSEIQGLNDIFNEFGSLLEIQRNQLDRIADELHETVINGEAAVKALEESLTRESLEENTSSSELAFLPETQALLEIHPPLTESVLSAEPSKLSTFIENGWATGVGAGIGLVTLGGAYMVAAPAALTYTVAASTGLLGFAGTKLHFNRDVLPSLPSLPSLPTWVPFIKASEQPTTTNP
jgi:hypothetical protein